MSGRPGRTETKDRPRSPPVKKRYNNLEPIRRGPLRGLYWTDRAVILAVVIGGPAAAFGFFAYLGTIINLLTNR